MSLEETKSQVDGAFTRKDLRGVSHENVFSGATSFLRRRYSKDLKEADIAVTGVPFDQAVTNRTGARLGPRSIREASGLQINDPPYGWEFDLLGDFAIVDYGDLAFDYARVQDFPAALTDHVAGILNADVPAFSMGGDHSITLPILRAYAAKFGPVALVQFDAHTDTWPDDDPQRIDHGTFAYKAVKEGLVDVRRSVHVGIRTVVEDNLGVAIVDAPEVHETGPRTVAEKLRRIVGGGPVYISFDIDALDPAFAPGTGTPVWGGLSSAQAAAILRGLRGIDIVGGDVVEVSPPYDPTGVTAVAGAHVLVEQMCLWGWKHSKSRG